MKYFSSNGFKLIQSILRLEYEIIGRIRVVKNGTGEQQDHRSECRRLRLDESAMHNTWNAGRYPLHARTWNVNKITQQHENNKTKKFRIRYLCSAANRKRDPVEKAMGTDLYGGGGDKIPLRLLRFHDLCCVPPYAMPKKIKNATVTTFQWQCDNSPVKIINNPIGKV